MRYGRDETYADEELIDPRAIIRGAQRRTTLILAVFSLIFSAVAIYTFTTTPYYTAEALVVIEPSSNIAIDKDISGVRQVINPTSVDTEVELIRSRAMAMRVALKLGLDQMPMGEKGLPHTEAFVDELVVEKVYPGVAVRRRDEAAARDVTTGGASPGSSVSPPGANAPLLDDRAGQTASAQSASAQSASAQSASAQSAAAEAASGEAASAAADTPLDFAATQRGTMRRMVPSRVLSQLERRVAVERVDRTYMIRIRYDSASPEASAAVANTYADQYIDQQIESRVNALRQANQWIETRIAELRDEVRATEETAARFRVDNRLIDSPEGSTVIQQRIGETVSALGVQRSLLSNFQARYESVRALQQREIPLESIPEVMQSQLIRDLRNQEAAVTRRAAELQSRYGPLHPDVKKVLDEKRDVSQQINFEISRIVNGLRSEVAVAENRIRMLEATLESLQEEAAITNPSQVRLQELERDTLVSRGRYEALLNRQKELNEREGLIEADARVISRAAPPESPSKPQKKVLLAGGFLLGLLLAGAAAFTAEMLDMRIRNTSDIRREFGRDAPVVLVPMVETNGWLKKDTPQSITEHYVVKSPHSGFAEALNEIRLLATEMFSELDPGSRSAVFAATRDGSGSSAIAFGVATLFAQTGKKVVYVDCVREELFRWNVRRGGEGPSVAGPAETLKISEAIDAEVTDRPSDDDRNPLRNFVARFNAGVGPEAKALATPDMSEIAFSDTTSPLSEAAGHMGFSSFFDRLNADHDIVIIHARPLLTASETSLMCARSDAVFLVAEWLVAKRDEVRIAMQRLADSRVNFAGFAVSKVNPNRRHFFGPEDRKFYFRANTRRSREM